MKDFVEVYRHQQPFVADMVIAALRDKDIPCYMQQGSITGIVVSPVNPAAAPGVEYIVYVPKAKYHEAKNIVDELPIDKELLNVKWIKSKDPHRRKLLWLFWILALGIPLILWLIIQIFELSGK